MACQLSSVKTTPPWISSLSLPLLALAWYLGYGFFSTTLSSMAVILSTLLILTKSKQSQSVAEEVTEEKETSQEEGQANEYPASETDSNGRTSTSEDVFMSSDWSDGSISDEGSLIEIALPSGQYVGNKQREQVTTDDQVKEPSLYVEKERQEFDVAAFFKQHGLMDLLAEVNEEENLIEIDLSMGSIKCPTRFEIEA